MLRPPKITPCLWFDDQAEEAARFYLTIFPHSKIDKITRYPAFGQEIHGKPAGSVLTVEFTLEGQSFTALNGGPQFRLSEAMSLQVMCDSQDEVDRYWTELGAGGDPQAQQCGWLKDKFGLFWQIVPRLLMDLIADPDAAKVGRVFAAMMPMKKLDIAELKKAAAG